LNKKVALPVLALGLATLAAAQSPAPQAVSAAPAAKPTAAPGPAPTKIAIINIQQAIASTKDGRKAATDLQNKFTPRRSALEKRQADIQTMQDQLRRGSATMSEEARLRMQKDVDNNTKSLQRDAQDLNDDVDQEQGKVVNDIGGKMMQVIEQYATQNGYAVVLDVSNQQTPVIWASASTEITGDIVQLYDQAHPGTAEPAAAASKPAAAAPKPAAAAPKPLATPVPKRP
jgi:outer membrane protein